MLSSLIFKVVRETDQTNGGGISYRSHFNLATRFLGRFF